MLNIFISWLIPTFLTACLGYIVKELRISRKNNIVIKESMIILLRSQITGKVENYISLGYLPNYARSCLEELYIQYKSLGGNHGMSQLIEQCFKLPPLKK